MKVCHIAQKELVFLGIGPYDPNKTNHLNPIIFVYSLLCFLSFSLSLAYLFLEAKTFDDVTQCIYIISASILSPMAVGSLAIQQKTLFHMCERLEVIIAESERKMWPWLNVLTWPNLIQNNWIIGVKLSASKRFYEEAFQESDQWSKRIFILILVIIPICATTLLLGTTLFLYFVSDLGNDAFMLAIPMWWVQ